MTPARPAALVAAFMLACTGGVEQPRTARSGALAGAHAEADWTLLVYMAADDDLEQAALENVEEMAEVGSSARVNVLVQIDRAPATRNGGGFTRAPLLNLHDFNSTKRLRIDRGSIEELEDLGETCTCDPDPLAAFIAWGLSTYPAKMTALVLWDHGGATHGFGWDITNDNKALSVVDLGRAVAGGLAAVHKRHFDVLGFDACLMSNLGVAYELRGSTDIFIGSEEFEPSQGWSYAPILRAMTAGASPRDLAREAVRSFEAECRATNATDMCTLAAFDASKLDDVVLALDEAGERLRTKSPRLEDWYPIARARVSAEQYGAGGGEVSPFATVDAVDFVTSAERARPGVLGVLEPPEQNRVARAVERATLASFFGAGRPNAHGLSLTFPRQPTERGPVDATLALATRAGSVAPWEQFLGAYLGYVSADKTAPRVLGLSVTKSPDTVDIHADLPDDDLAEAAAVVGVADVHGVLTVLSTTSLSVASLPIGSVHFLWPKRLPAIGDGRDIVPVTVFAEPSYRDAAGNDDSIESVAGMLQPHGVVANEIEVLVYLKVSPVARPLVVGAYRFTGGGPGSEVALHEDDRFAPEVRTVAVDGKLTRTASQTTIALGDPRQLRLEERPAPPGEYVVGFRVTDYAANRIWQTMRVQIP